MQTSAPDNPWASRTVARVALLAALLGSLSFPGLATAQTYVTLMKSKEYTQTSANAPSTTNQFDLQFQVDGASNPAPTVKIASGTDAGDTSTAPYISSSGKYFIESSGYSTETALNDVFGSGTYNIHVNGTKATSLGFPSGDLYPNLPTPSFTQSSSNPLAGTWSNGTYMVDPTQSLTIATNAFTTNFASGQVAMNLAINSLDGDNVSLKTLSAGTGSTDTTQSDSVSLSVPAFSLTPGDSYQVTIDFIDYVNPTSTGPSSLADPDTSSIPGYTLISGFQTEDDFTITAIPEPAASAAIAGLVALGLGYYGIRSRRSAALPR
jgi:hypothetical protein